MELFLLLILQILGVECFVDSFLEQKISYKPKGEGDMGEPLFLTPYIESGKIEEAKKLARVSLPEFSYLESYAGFFTVDKVYNSNQFVWYFHTPSISGLTIVWLQGGPGVSSLFGLFDEIGPILVKDGKFHSRGVHWGDISSIIFIDNPVGAGFSFTDDVRGYTTNQTQIGEQLYTTLYQFYQMFPEELNGSLIISGESYGGKYAPALAYTIHKKNLEATAQGNTVLPLKGLTIGNGFCDPINQLGYSDYLYQLGLIDLKSRVELEGQAEIVRQYIEKEDWSQAYEHNQKFIENINKTMGGRISFYDYTTDNDAFDNLCSYCELINTPWVRKAIHVGNLTFDNFNVDVYNFLQIDMLQSVAPWISELLEDYKLLFYNGQYDIIVAYPLTVNFIQHMNWTEKQAYDNATRIGLILVINDDEPQSTQIAYIKDGGNLWDVLVRGAGHMVPANQPLWAKAMLFVWLVEEEILKSQFNNTFLNTPETQIIKFTRN